MEGMRSKTAFYLTLILNYS